MKNAAEADATRVFPGFFATDCGAFRCAAVGGLNAAVPSGDGPRGTCPNNRTTQWSVHYLPEQFTGE
jgi:hypothetical protein